MRIFAYNLKFYDLNLLSHLNFRDYFILNCSLCNAVHAHNAFLCVCLYPFFAVRVVFSCVYLNHFFVDIFCGTSSSYKAFRQYGPSYVYGPSLAC